ncbi:ABC transporter ATP-binding protein [Aliiroseovarius sp. KMU-71]|uniref:ABC transporter ATP-binding protein n=1 Tax=Aliiroseovarius sp. KMU-71 TaxID=3453123 RepID=UPI003F48B1E3
MIEMRDVSIRYPGTTVPILDGATVRFEPGEKVGILAPASSGKSSLARLFAGIEQPTSGAILHQGRISWPLGFSGAIHPELTCGDNVALLAQLVGEDPNRVIAFCRDFSELGDAFRKPAKYLTPVERSKLAFALSLAPRFDTYIADETISVGDPGFREKCDALMHRRLKTAGLVFLSRNARQLRKTCNRYFVLLRQQLVPCDDLDVAQYALEIDAKRQKDAELEASHGTRH